MKTCPCGLKKTYEDCCQPIITGKIKAPTAEAVMRARYSAFVKQQIPYLRSSLTPKTRDEFDETSVTNWAKNSEWTGLEVHSVEGGGPTDSEGTVVFTAHYKFEGKDCAHKETAFFKKEKSDQTWYYADGKTAGVGTIVRDAPKTGRNDPCTCGSGKKFKKCCG